MKEVTVWVCRAQSRVGLLERAPDPDSFQPWLPEHEIRMAKSLQIAGVRDRYLRSRAFMRRVLSRYLGTPPHEIGFKVTREGKPSVDSPRSALQFNLSHSSGVIALAVDECDAVGVDIEAHRDIKNQERVFERIASAQELTTWRGLSTHAERQEFFYRTWTRKESLCKAMGVGIFTPQVHFDVQCANPHSRWHLYTLRLGEGLSGAVTTWGPAQPRIHEFAC